MNVLGIIMIIVHILLSVGVIFFALKRMQKNAELGGAFGGGASSAHFGREKGFDSATKFEMVFTALFMVSCFVTTMVLL
jgi:preprotein translocase subunit SecG